MQSFIGEIGIFMICAQAILHFRPKESYGKYLRLLFSVMILIQIFQPVSELLFGGSGVELQKSIEQFQERLDESMEQATEVAAGTEQRLEKMSMEELRKYRELQGEQTEMQKDMGSDMEGNMESKGQNEMERNGKSREIRIEQIGIEEIHITREED